MTNNVRNIVFSTTRQWNPGDEIILFGVRRIFENINAFRFNPVIYNRNPDLRSGFPGTEWPSNSFGFFDNSFKPNQDGSVYDWVVFAGTPEWCEVRSYDLYRQVLKHNLPVMIIGVGGGCTPYKEWYREVIGKAKVLTVREEKTLEAVRKQGFSAEHLPCPALLSAPPEKEKTFDAVRKIGLIYQSPRDESVFWGSLRSHAYEYQLEFLQKILARYGEDYDISIVAHYVDEIELAKRLFPDLPIHYAYDSADYFDIYGEFDVVIGARVHGIGAAASLGVPGVALSHDARGVTCKGFLADIVTVDTDMQTAIGMVQAAIDEAPARNRALHAHKRETMKQYAGRIAEALRNSEVRYEPQTIEEPNATHPPVAFLSERVDQLSIAHEESQAMALVRAKTISELEDRIDKTQAALDETQIMAVERGTRISELEARVDRTQAAYEDRVRAVEQADLERIAHRDHVRQLEDALRVVRAERDEALRMAGLKGIWRRITGA